MKLTNLYTILTVLLVLNLPLTAKSETFGQDTIKCPFTALHANKISEFPVIYTKRNKTIALEAALLDARNALVSFWDKQLTGSKDLYIEPIDLKMKGNIDRLTALAPVAITIYTENTKLVD